MSATGQQITAEAWVVEVTPHQLILVAGADTPCPAACGPGYQYWSLHDHEQILVRTPFLPLITGYMT